MQEKTLEALIYGRVSDPKQKTQGHGLESQEHSCRQFAEQNGLVVKVKPFLDDVTGWGNYSKRPAMNDMLDHIRSHPETDFAVIFDDIKRFSRDIYFYWDLIYQLEKYNAIPMSPNFEFEKTPEGKLKQTVTIGASEYERESNARQTRQKMTARIEAGFHVFIAPVGFEFKVTKTQGKVLVRKEPEASLIGEAIEGVASGRFQSKSEARYFLEQSPGFPVGKSGKMGNSRIDKILTDPLYAGYVGYEPWGVALRKGRHKGMVTYETFCKAQERLKGCAHAPARKDLNLSFPMRGSVLCECGNALTAAKSRSATGKYYDYYVCQNRKCEYKGKSIRPDVLEGDFEKLLKTLAPTDVLLDSAKQMFKDIWQHFVAAEETRIEQWVRQVKTIDADIERMLDRIVKVDHPKVIKELESRIVKLEDQKRVIEEKIGNKGQSFRPFDEMYRTALDFLLEPHKLWAKGLYEGKRAVLKLTFASRLTYVRNQGYRTPDLSLPFKVLGDIFMLEKQMVPRGATV